MQAIVGMFLAAILAPLPALLVGAFPTHMRDTDLTLSCNLPVTIFGELSSLIVTWLIGVTHTKTLPSFYVFATTLTSLASLWMLYRRARADRT